MILLAIKDFPVFAPLVNKVNAKRAERKGNKKQARIEELERKLDELKKSGK